MRIYEIPTLTALGSFAETTGRCFCGFYAETFAYDWSPTKLNPR